MKKTTKVRLKKISFITIAVLLVISMLLPVIASADEITEEIKGKPKPGDVIVTLGNNLSQEQRFSILNEFNVVESEVPIVVVTIDEERTYLGSFISAQKIGNKSFSSAKIEILEEGSGVVVSTSNISWVSEAMYANALITAGIKDAKVTVTAPFEVSGTGALTGVIKAYEQYEEVEISEENKEVANQEMVTTAELSNEIGKEEASILMTKIKELIANEKFKDKEALGKEIKKIVDEMGLTIDESTFNELTDLFFKMSELDIDWDQVSDQLEQLKTNVLDLVGDSTEKAEGFFAKVVEFFQNLWDSIVGIFSGKDKDPVEEPIEEPGVVEDPAEESVTEPGIVDESVDGSSNEKNNTSEKVEDSIIENKNNNLDESVSSDGNVSDGSISSDESVSEGSEGVPSGAGVSSNEGASSEEVNSDSKE